MAQEALEMGEDRYISLHPGTIIAGRYEVLRCLGAGSMGLVYACRHKELSDHLVAVKVLFPEVAKDAVATARFKNEIFASYDVSHPNVVRAYEYIRDGELVAYTMEYVGGGDLAQKLENGQALTVDETVEILCQMCVGVQAIHNAGIVHRDLKPENILLTKDNIVKIADFGIARTGYGPKLTEHGGVVGTIDYVSPEYMLNSQVDWRSDIYAMGILGYEMITGRLPFKAESVYASMTKRLKSDPPMPSAINPLCPPELDAIILKAMSRDLHLRFQSASEMLTRLQPLLKNNKKIVSSAFMVNSRDTATENDRSSRDPLVIPAEISGSMNKKQLSGSVRYKEDVTRVTTTELADNMKVQASPSTRVNEVRNQVRTQVLPNMNQLAGSYGTPEIVTVSDHYGEETNNQGLADYYDTIGAEGTIELNGKRRKRSDSEMVPNQVLKTSSEWGSANADGLDETATTKKSSPLIEIFTLVMAAILGIGLGFFLVKLFFPQVLGL